MNILKRDAVNTNAEIAGAQPALKLGRGSRLGLQATCRQKPEQRSPAHDLAHRRLGKCLERNVRLGDAQGEAPDRLGAAGVQGILKRGRDLQELAVSSQNQTIGILMVRPGTSPVAGSPTAATRHAAAPIARTRSAGFARAPVPAA